MNVLEMQLSILIMAFAGHICYQKCVLFGLLSSHSPTKSIHSLNFYYCYHIFWSLTAWKCCFCIIYVYVLVFINILN